jgi:hypothetical protein
MNPPTNIPHDLIRNGRAGRLVADVEFLTPITGYRAQVQQSMEGRGGKYWVDATLCHDGRLCIRSDTEWDFGTGAINTPPVVRASLVHDVFCHLTMLGRIPWECRAEADAYYRQLLIAYGCSKIRAWYQWAAVRGYSKSIAYWKRTK